MNPCDPAGVTRISTRLRLTEIGAEAVGQAWLSVRANLQRPPFVCQPPYPPHTTHPPRDNPVSKIITLMWLLKFWVKSVLWLSGLGRGMKCHTWAAILRFSVANITTDRASQTWRAWKSFSTRAWYAESARSPIAVRTLVIIPPEYYPR